MKKNRIKRVLITGASGLLGRSLVNEFLDKGFYVLGQYFQHRLEERPNCQWLQADFSELKGIRDFLGRNASELKECECLVNNYGPITYKSVDEVEAEDFIYDYHHNVITAVEITNYFIHHTDLKAVVNIGFELAGQMRSFKKVLTYACAKNALLIITKSNEKKYPGISFNMVCPATLQGAEVKAKNGTVISPGEVAGEVMGLITEKKKSIERKVI
jgi:NAD(P)-dependent dehydrogenase (short-subunit alcohol dehydrogenase family)